MEVGVDIEAIRATTDIDRMAARFLSQAEQRRLGLLSPAQREPAFFQCWTRKEALLKGVGTGLRFPLREVDVWDGDGRPATVSGWSVHDVDLAPGFAAAVAGASLDDWVPPVPRRLRALSPEIRTDYRQAVAPAARWRQGGDVVITGTREATVLPQVDQVIATEPQRVAVRAPDAVLSYGELSIRADHLARRLRHLGVKPGDLVGQCLERSASLVVAALAIVRAGGAYVAIDPAYPAERVQWMLDDCRRRRGGERRQALRHSWASPAIDRPSWWRTAESCRTTRIRTAIGRSPVTGTDRPRLRGVHVRIDRAPQRGAGGTRRPGEPRRMALRCVRFARRRPLHPDLQPGIRCGDLGDLAQPGRGCGASTSSPNTCGRDPIRLRDWLVMEGITVTFLPTPVAEGIIGLDWPERLRPPVPADRGRRLDQETAAGPGVHAGQQLRAQRDLGRRYIWRRRSRWRRSALDRPSYRRSGGRGR